MTHFFEYRNVAIPVSGFNTAVGRFAFLFSHLKIKSVKTYRIISKTKTDLHGILGMINFLPLHLHMIKKQI